MKIIWEEARYWEVMCKFAQKTIVCMCIVQQVDEIGTRSEMAIAGSFGTIYALVGSTSLLAYLNKKKKGECNDAFVAQPDPGRLSPRR